MRAYEVAIHQLKNNFCLSDGEAEKIEEAYGRLAEEKAIECLSHVNSKYEYPTINPFNSVIYCNYLYWLSRIAYLDQNREIADKVYYLNRMLNSVDLFYEIKLPDIWSCEHPLGSIMGRAIYGEYFFFCHGCTVGANYRDGKMQHPTIGDHVIMYSNSKIIGDCNIGRNSIITANCYIKAEDIPPDSIVFGQSPNLVIKPNKEKKKFFKE